MRSMPTTTRIAIATLFLRYRNARVEARRAAEHLGSSHPGAIAVDGRATEIWNSLLSVRMSVDSEIADERISIGDAHAFVAFAARSARVRQQAHERLVGTKAA